MGRDGGRRPVLGRRSHRSYFSPPPSSSSFLLLFPPPSSSSESCREPQPKQAAAAAAGTARQSSSNRAAVSLQRSKTRDEASALRSPAAAGRLQPGSLSLSLFALHSRPSPPHARPSPPPGRAAEAPSLALCCSARAAPLRGRQSPGRCASHARATQGAPGPQESPRREGGRVWVATGKQEWSLGKREGAIWGRRRSEGGGSERGCTAAAEPRGGGGAGAEGTAGDLLALTQQVKATPGSQLDVGVWVRGSGTEIYIFVRFSKGLLGQSSTWNLWTCCGEAPGKNREGRPRTMTVGWVRVSRNQYLGSHPWHY